MKILGRQRNESSDALDGEDVKNPNASKLKRGSPRKRDRHLDQLEATEIRDDISKGSSRSSNASASGTGKKYRRFSRLRSLSPRPSSKPVAASTETLLNLPQFETETYERTRRRAESSPPRWFQRKEELDRGSVDPNPVLPPCVANDHAESRDRVEEEDASECLTGPPRRLAAPQRITSQSDHKPDLRHVLSSGSVDPVLPPRATRKQNKMEKSPGEKSNEEQSDDLERPPRRHAGPPPTTITEMEKAFFREQLQKRRGIQNVLSSGSVDPVLPPRTLETQSPVEQRNEQVTERSTGGTIKSTIELENRTECPHGFIDRQQERIDAKPGANSDDKLLENGRSFLSFPFLKKKMTKKDKTSDQPVENSLSYGSSSTQPQLPLAGQESGKGGIVRTRSVDSFYPAPARNEVNLTALHARFSDAEDEVVGILPPKVGNRPPKPPPTPRVVSVQKALDRLVHRPRRVRSMDASEKAPSYLEIERLIQQEERDSSTSEIVPPMQIRRNKDSPTDLATAENDGQKIISSQRGIPSPAFYSQQQKSKRDQDWSTATTFSDTNEKESDHLSHSETRIAVSVSVSSAKETEREDTKSNQTEAADYETRSPSQIPEPESYEAFEAYFAEQTSSTPVAEVAPPSVQHPKVLMNHVSTDKGVDSIGHDEATPCEKKPQNRLRSWFRQNKPKNHKKHFMSRVAEVRPTSPVDFESADVEEIEEVLAYEPSRSFDKVGPPLKLEGRTEETEASSAAGPTELVRKPPSLDPIDTDQIKRADSDSCQDHRAPHKWNSEDGTDSPTPIKTEVAENASTGPKEIVKVDSESYEAFEALVKTPCKSQTSVKGPPLALDPSKSLTPNRSTVDDSALVASKEIVKLDSESYEAFEALVKTPCQSPASVKGPPMALDPIESPTESNNSATTDGSAPKNTEDSTAVSAHIDPESFLMFESIANAPSSSSAVVHQKDIPKLNMEAPSAPQHNRHLSIMNGISFNFFTKKKKEFGNRVIETRVESPVNFEDVEAVERILKEEPTQSFPEQAPPTFHGHGSVQKKVAGSPDVNEKRIFSIGRPWRLWLRTPFQSDEAPLENARAKNEKEEEEEGLDGVEMSDINSKESAVRKAKSGDPHTNESPAAPKNVAVVEATSSVESDVFTDFDLFCGYNYKRDASLAVESGVSASTEDEVDGHESILPGDPFSAWKLFSGASNPAELKNGLLSKEEKEAAKLPGDNELNGASEKAKALLPSMVLVLFSCLLVGFLYYFAKNKFSLFDRDFFVDWDRQINVAFIGGAYLVINDVPRLTQALSQGRMTQNSVLHPSVGSVARILETGNGMYYQWSTDEAFLGTHTNDYGFNVADYDFGLCTVKQLFYGQDQNIGDGETYEEDGRNPCIQDEYYLELLEEKLNEQYIPWNFVVITDQTKRMAIEEAREYTTEALTGSYASMLSYSGAIPVILDTHAFLTDDMTNSGAFDLPSFQTLIHEGAIEYAEALSSVLPEEQAPIIAPVGLAFLLVYEDDETKWEKLISSDGVHASIHGTYLTACVLYATMYGHLPQKRFSTHGIDDLFAKSRKLFDENIEYPTTREANYYRKIARRVVILGEMPASLTSGEGVANNAEDDDAIDNESDGDGDANGDGDQ